MNIDLETLRNLLEPPLDRMGYELVHLECATDGGRRVLRLYIDAPGGIGVDDCEAVSRRVSVLLDVEDEDALPSAYLLEVSSPGLDRPLVKPEHFRRFAGTGSRARIVMQAGVGGRRRFTGELREADERRVVLEVDGEHHELAYDQMDTARLDPVF